MSASVEYRYGMRTPCPKCPFRVDVEPYLRAGRAQEIAEGLAQGGGEFPCHATTVSQDDDEGNDVRVEGPKSRFCAGAMATMFKGGQPNQMLRIAERQGWIDPARLRAAFSLVHRSLGEWALSFRDDIQYAEIDGEQVPFVHCHAADDECEDPPGFSDIGENPEPGTLDPSDPSLYCEACGEPICPACRSERWSEPSGRVCAICYDPANYDADDAPPERDDDYDYE